MSPSRSFILGILAAVGSPLFGTVGFIMWDEKWKGSAFALNLFKCTLASILFLLVVVVESAVWSSSSSSLFDPERFTTQTTGFLFLSSTIGIIIGDWTWLQGLQILGARRVILVDAAKPFLGAVLGRLFLDEKIRLEALAGIIMVVAGILIVELKKEPEKEQQQQQVPSPGIESEQQQQQFKEESDEKLAINSTNFTGLSFRELKNCDVSTAHLQQSEANDGTSFLAANTDGKTKRIDTAADCTFGDIGGDKEKYHLSSPPMQLKSGIIITSNETLGKASTTKSAANFLDADHAVNLSNGNKVEEKEKHLQQHEQQHKLREQQESNSKTVRERVNGYGLAVTNVVLDTFGSLLTKQYGSNFTTWEINLLRFGFAAVVLIAISLTLSIWRCWKNHQHPRPRNEPALENTERATKHKAKGTRKTSTESISAETRTGDTSDNNTYNNNHTYRCDNQEGRPRMNADKFAKESASHDLTPWYQLPCSAFQIMSLKSWMLVSLGVIMTTFLCPTLSNYALFQIALAFALTLGSIGPLYSLPLTYWLQGEPITVRALLGALLAVAGVIVLSLRGSSS